MPLRLEMNLPHHQMVEFKGITVIAAGLSVNIVRKNAIFSNSAVNEEWQRRFL